MVAKYSRDVVDVVRLEEAKKQDEAGRKLTKGSRYLLLKNAPNLTGTRRKWPDTKRLSCQATRPLTKPLPIPAYQEEMAEIGRAFDATEADGREPFDR